MRDILFRGRTIGTGVWVDGSLFIDDKKDKHESSGVAVSV